MGLGVFAKCMVCAQITLGACFICHVLGGWPLLECPTERKEQLWPITLQFMSQLWAFWERTSPLTTDLWLSSHTKAAGIGAFLNACPGWTFAILPMASSVLASDTGSSDRAQPSLTTRRKATFHFNLKIDIADLFIHILNGTYNGEWFDCLPGKR